jgi:hypothetical protein
MDKNTKMLLGVGAVAVVGYLVYQQMNKKSFAGEKMNASGRGIFAPTGGVTSRRPVCKGGLYATYNTGAMGQVTSTTFHDCKTGAETGTSLGYITQW